MNETPPPVGGMTFPTGPPPQPQAVPTIPAELLQWGSSVVETLTAVDRHLGLIFKLLQEQRELLLVIAGSTKTSVLRAERQDAVLMAEREDAR